MNKVARTVECFHDLPTGPIAVSEALRDPESFFRAYSTKLSSARSFRKGEFFKYKFLIRGDSSSPFGPVDPALDDAPWNDWSTLVDLLRGAGRSLFEPPVTTTTFETASHLRRFRLAWSIEDVHAERALVRRVKHLATSDEDASNIFSTVGAFDPKLEALPTPLREAWLAQLSTHISIDESVFVLPRFIDDAAACLEDAVVLHFALFSRLADAIVQRFASSSLHPQEIVPFHLVPYSALDVDRQTLFAFTRARVPSFQVHPLLQTTTALTNIESRLSAPTTIEIAPATVGSIQVDDQTTLDPQPLDEDTEKLLTLMQCELSFLRYRANDQAPVVLDGARAVMIAEQAGALTNTWIHSPSAVPVDEDDFWLEQVWTFSPDGKSRGTISMTSLRYALYDPPYGGCGPWLITKVEKLLFAALFSAPKPRDRWQVFTVDTQESSFFINEWWDFCWVAADRLSPTVLVIYGTATD